MTFHIQRKTIRTLQSALLVGCASFALTAPVNAQDAGDPVSGILACRQITDQAARLECFDRTSGQLQTARDSGDVAIVLREDVEAVERDTFGLDLPSLPRLNLSMFGGNSTPRAPAPNPLDPAAPADGGSAGSAVSTATTTMAANDESNGVQVLDRDNDGSVERITMVIDRIETYTYNKHRFYMENGQVWRQLDTSRVRLPRNQINEAEIRRAAMGSYLLRINGRGQAIRVIRDR